MESWPKSRAGRLLSAVSLAIFLVVIVVALFADQLHPLSKLGVAVLFGSAIPRSLTPWIDYSATTFKRLFVLRFVGMGVGLVLLVLGGILE